MANITIKLNTDNAAFDDNGSEELEYVLKQAANIIESGDFSKSIRDTNGNKVGTVEVA